MIQREEYIRQSGKSERTIEPVYKRRGNGVLARLAEKQLVRGEI